MTEPIHVVPGTTERPAAVYVVGARPNFVKMAPVVAEMRARAPQLRHLVIHTGQHYDAGMSDVFFTELGLPAPDRSLHVGSGRHGQQTAVALERLESVLMEIQPRVVVVPGDVNSTLAAALAAAKLNVPVAHLEAGLRSFDRTMPEEINRVLVDQLSRWCFIHSPEADANLEREGVTADRRVFAGNTMIDTLVRLLPRISASDVLTRLGLRRHDYVLVTLHRPALVDGPVFSEVIEALAELAAQRPVVFPVHPRTRARWPAGDRGLAGVRLIDPVGYLDFVALEAGAAGVLTDSGGVQEETTFLGVPCFTLRDSTERPVTVTHGTNHMLGLCPAAIPGIAPALGRPRLAAAPPSGWDGRAAARVADTLIPWLSAGADGTADSQATSASTPVRASSRASLRPS